LKKYRAGSHLYKNYNREPSLPLAVTWIELRMNTRPCHVKQSKVSSERHLTLLGMTGQCGHEVKKQKRGQKPPRTL